MKINVSQIYEGWKNHIHPENKLKEIINITSEERLKICRECSFNSLNRKNYSTLRLDEHCIDCGCTLIAKTKCLSCECPQNKWKAVVTEDEYKIMKNEK